MQVAGRAASAQPAACVELGYEGEWHFSMRLLEQHPPSTIEILRYTGPNDWRGVHTLIFGISGRTVRGGGSRVEPRLGPTASACEPYHALQRERDCEQSHETEGSCSARPIGST